MIKAGRRTRAVRSAPEPSWISDKENQTKWNGTFIEILRRDYRTVDATISAILSDPLLSQLCATKIRSYVDKDVTIWLYAQRKLRGAGHKDDLEIAIPGIKAAIDLSVNQADSEEAGHLVELQAEFSRQLACSNTAYATKRHGRDRAHSILDECHSFLESALGRSVTDRTLANLVNAGYEADGNLLTEPVTEEHIRKNLATFRKNNPNWRNNINSLVH